MTSLQGTLVSTPCSYVSDLRDRDNLSTRDQTLAPLFKAVAAINVKHLPRICSNFSTFRTLYYVHTYVATTRDTIGIT